jgi:alpha-amylase
MTPTEIADTMQPVSAISIPSAISWADEERDITAWQGNELQVAAWRNFTALQQRLINAMTIRSGKTGLTFRQAIISIIWQPNSSPMVQCMHISIPYETPYDAFMNYMNVLSDFEIRLRRYFPDTHEQDQIYNMGAELIEKEMIISKQTSEIERLNRKVAKSLRPRRLP